MRSFRRHVVQMLDDTCIWQRAVNQRHRIAYDLRDPVPLIYSPLPYAGVIEHLDNVPPEAPDTAIVLECDSIAHSFARSRRPVSHQHRSPWQRTRVRQRELDRQQRVRRSRNGFSAGTWCGRRVTPEMATCLYTAVLTDTGSFCFAGTDAHTFELAVELVRCGANPVDIAQHVYFSNPTSKMRLLGAALSNLHREGTLVYMHLCWTRWNSAVVSKKIARVL